MADGGMIHSSDEGTLTIRQAGPADALSWDAFVDCHPQGTFFHRFGWAEVISRTYGHEPRFLIAERAGEIVAIAPVMFIRSPFFGKSLISTAFTVGGGLLGDPAATAQLAVHLENLSAELGVGYAELRGGEAPVGWQTKDDVYAGFARAITADHDANLKAIPRKKRADVRKGIKAAEARNLLVRHDADPDAFYPLYAESVRNLGTPVFPRKLLANLIDVFTGAVEISVVEAEGQAVAGLVSFTHGDTVLPYYGGAKPAARGLHAYDYMYWAQLCRAAEKGLTRFDFGRSKVGTGAYNYKSWWGFEPTPLTYHYHLHTAKEMPNVNPNNPKFRLITETWQKLPLPVANRLGPVLAGNLA